MAGGVVSVPQWVEILLGEKFFRPCVVHECAKIKKENNMFCLECCASICAHCLPPHRLHSLLQIRRYVYHDVIRLGDAQKLLDCSLVQSYTINKAKVVFLKERPLSRSFRASGNLCIKCDRSLQHPFLFCSLSCKVNHIANLRKETNKQQKLVYNGQETKSLPELEDDQITADSVLDSPGFVSSGSSDNIISNSAVISSNDKKKRSSVISLFPRPGRCSRAAATSRRKSVPQRSPLY